MKVIKVKNYEEMSKVAAEIFKDVVKNKPNAVLGLATGTTPLGLYSELIKDHKEYGTCYKNIIEGRNNENTRIAKAFEEK